MKHLHKTACVVARMLGTLYQVDARVGPVFSRGCTIPVTSGRTDDFQKQVSGNCGPTLGKNGGFEMKETT